MSSAFGEDHVTVRRVGFTLAAERWGLLTYTPGRPAESNAVKRAWFPVLPSGHCLIPLFHPSSRNLPCWESQAIKGQEGQKGSPTKDQE